MSSSSLQFVTRDRPPPTTLVVCFSDIRLGSYQYFLKLTLFMQIHYLSLRRPNSEQAINEPVCCVDWRKRNAWNNPKKQRRRELCFAEPPKCSNCTTNTSNKATQLESASRPMRMRTLWTITITAAAVALLARRVNSRATRAIRRDLWMGIAGHRCCFLPLGRALTVAIATTATAASMSPATAGITQHFHRTSL